MDQIFNLHQKKWNQIKMLLWKQLQNMDQIFNMHQNKRNQIKKLFCKQFHTDKIFHMQQMNINWFFFFFFKLMYRFTWFNKIIYFTNGASRAVNRWYWWANPPYPSLLHQPPFLASPGDRSHRAPWLAHLLDRGWCF